MAIYTAKVRITVHADGAAIVREGHGSGEGRGGSPGEVHDIALKAAKPMAPSRHGDRKNRLDSSFIAGQKYCSAKVCQRQKEAAASHRLSGTGLPTRYDSDPRGRRIYYGRRHARLDD
jgi:hypothetical protein